MSNYTQLYVQLVFAVSHRDAMITSEVESRLYPYIIGIAAKRKCTIIAIGGMPDHVHILLSLHPSTSISDLVRDIKTNSNLFINNERLTKGRFEWQANYAAFSYSKSQVPRVKRYIQNQKAHHAQRSFREELLWMLEQCGMEYNEQYGFTWIDAVAAGGRPAEAEKPVGT